MAGDMHGGGNVWQGGCMTGVCMEGGVCSMRDSHCSGRYVSYWNAFLYNTTLLSIRFPQVTTIKFIYIKGKVYILPEVMIPH